MTGRTSIIGLGFATILLSIGALMASAQVDPDHVVRHPTPRPPHGPHQSNQDDNSNDDQPPVDPRQQLADDLARLQSAAAAAVSDINNLATERSDALAAADQADAAGREALAKTHEADAAHDVADKQLAAANQNWDATVARAAEARKNLPEAMAADRAQATRDQIGAAPLAPLYASEPYQAAAAQVVEAQSRLDTLHAMNEGDPNEVFDLAATVLEAQGVMDRLENSALSADPAWVKADMACQQCQAALKTAQVAFDAKLKADPLYAAAQKEHDAALAKVQDTDAACLAARNAKDAAAVAGAQARAKAADAQRRGEQRARDLASLRTQMAPLQTALDQLN
jgi:hypothetical protein